MIHIYVLCSLDFIFFPGIKFTVCVIRQAREKGLLHTSVHGKKISEQIFDSD